MSIQKALILIFLFLPAFLPFQNSRAQAQQTGVVKDILERYPLEDVHVILIELNKGTSTSRKGTFSFDALPEGKYTLRISHIGYEELNLPLVVGEKPEEIVIFIRPVLVEIDPVTITATLNLRRISGIPGRGSVIDKKQADLIPAQNADDLLLGIANIYVNRPYGIFSKGASVSMRGLPGSARTLILLDGVPMNKLAGGTVNWNFPEPADIERIEVIKGPSSALYGNNAMGGVISMTTRKPYKKLDGLVRAFGGSMGTYGGSLMIGGKNNPEKGFSWNTNTFIRKGDGYIIQPEKTRDTTDVKTGLSEYNMGLEAGYQFDSCKILDVEYRYYNGTFGTGTRIYEEDGSWDQYRSHLAQAKFEGEAGKYKLSARIYYQLENFDRQNESINSTGKYRLSDSKSVKHDNGLWVNISSKLFRGHLFTAGMDIKAGDLKGEEIYRTSTDEVDYGGKLVFAGIFVQDEFNLLSKLSVIAGMRLDHASFYDGFQTVMNPTSNTGFIKNSEMTFTNGSWIQWSPKLALQYNFGKNAGAYVSFSTGFMPPKIDDLTRSGKISKGFKIANPQLSPEVVFSYEGGITWMVNERFSMEPSVYYTRGYDFQYFVATGDSVETGGADLKPVMQRQNVTEVEILGAEISVKWEVFDNFVLSSNYALNHSAIIAFNDPMNLGKDLVGKALIEVPLSQAYAAISWRNRILNVNFDWRYTGKEWYDDENTQYLPPYSVFGLKINKTFPGNIEAGLSVQNLFDNVTMDRKGMLSPGRFIIAELIYRI